MNAQSPCPNCGGTTTDVMIMPHGYVHYAQLICHDCHYHLKWLRKPAWMKQQPDNPWLKPTFNLGEQLKLPLDQ